jgi:hypothetical protein
LGVAYLITQLVILLHQALHFLFDAIV